MIWPMLRTIPNNTHASLMRRFAWNASDMVSVNGQSLSGEKVGKITLDGTMTVESTVALPRKAQITMTRVVFPSVISSRGNSGFLRRKLYFIPRSTHYGFTHQLYNYPFSVVFRRSSEAGVALIFCLLFYQEKSKTFDLLITFLYFSLIFLGR